MSTQPKAEVEAEAQRLTSLKQLEAQTETKISPLSNFLFFNHPFHSAPGENGKRLQNVNEEFILKLNSNFQFSIFHSLNGKTELISVYLTGI